MSESRDWQPGDGIALALPLEPRRLRAHPAVRQQAGRMAVVRGPLVYCLEGADNGSGLNSILLEPGAGQAGTGALPDLGDAIAIHCRCCAKRLAPGVRISTPRKTPATEPDTARLVPYHLWDDRQPGEMLVWVREARS